MKFKVEKGTAFVLPVYGLHHDQKYFPDPEKFDPERFSDENKNSIVQGTYIPFGVGPRNCIGNTHLCHISIQANFTNLLGFIFRFSGSRFALMELKAILYYLLLNFSFDPNKQTQIPIKLTKSAFTLLPENGMHLELKPRID